MNLTDKGKTERITSLISGYYVNLHRIHQERDQALKVLKGKENPGKKVLKQKGRVNKTAEKETGENHSTFLKDLRKELSQEQTDQVKDGLTYGVLPLTYKGYQDMLPDLTPEQKAKILEWLSEAREKAMDGGSSEEKHAWFGKYKGRINNYLSAQGYDLKKAGEEWKKSSRKQQ